MLNMYIPTIENHSKDHADWYRNFSTAFNLSQLSNYLLLSYITTQVEQNKKIIFMQNEYKLGSRECKTSEDRADLIESLDIIDMLNQITAEFSLTTQKHNQALFYRGIQIKGFHDENVKIDLHDILSSTTENNWSQVIRGLINVFEFLFIFSITEDHLKEIVNQENSKSIVAKALKDKPGFIEHLENRFKMPRNFIIKTWDLYLEIRNLYAHSFGYINEKDKSQIREKRDAFIDAYQKLPMTWHLFDQDATENLFKDEKLITQKLYLISTSEICVFRNVIRKLIPELSKWENRESPNSRNA